MLRPTKVLQGPHISAHHIRAISTYQRPSEFPRLKNSAQLTLKVIVHLGCSQVADDSCCLKMAVHYRKLDTNIIHGIFHVISCYLISWYGIRNAAISFPNGFPSKWFSCASWGLRLGIIQHPGRLTSCKLYECNLGVSTSAALSLPRSYVKSLRNTCSHYPVWWPSGWRTTRLWQSLLSFWSRR